MINFPAGYLVFSYRPPLVFEDQVGRLPFGKRIEETVRKQQRPTSRHLWGSALRGCSLATISHFRFMPDGSHVYGRSTEVGQGGSREGAVIRHMAISDYLRLRNSASGPEIGLPGRISTGF